MAGRASALLIGVMLVASCSQASSEPLVVTAPAVSAPASPSAGPSAVPIEAEGSLGPHDGSLRAFAPADSEIIDVRAIASSGSVPAQMVLTWARGRDDYSEFGLLLWQHTGSGEDTWGVAYRLQDRKFTGVRRAGPPGYLRRSRNGLGISGIDVDVGDLTADGHADLLTVERGSGSGYCSIFRVLATGRGKVRPIYFERTCDTSMRITEDGLLLIDEATRGKNCENIHGCGRRIRLLRWTGTGWEQVSSREKS